MRTSIKTQIAKLTITLLAVVIIPVSIFAADKNPVKQAADSHFKKISIQGNVEVTLIQREAEGVIYTDDNAGIVNVIKTGNKLEIIGVTNGSSKIFLYVNDIYRIEAADNVKIKSEGTLTTKFLQVFLKGNARADIHINTKSLYTSLQDNTNLKLSGSTTSHTQEMSKTPKLNTKDFVVFDAKTSSSEILAMENDELPLK